MSKVKISNGWMWSALIAISFLLMLCAKLFAGWTIPWWIVTLPLWIMPALVISIIWVCMMALVGVGLYTILTNLFWWIVGGKWMNEEKDNYDDYDDYYD